MCRLLWTRGVRVIPGHRGAFHDLGGDALGDFLRLFRRRPMARAYGVMLGVEIEDERAEANPHNVLLEKT